MKTRTKRAREIKKEESVAADLANEPVYKKSKTHAPGSSVFDNFKQGDLLFGLLEPRNKVMDAIIKQNSDFHHMVANDLNEPVIKRVINNDVLVVNKSELGSEEEKHFMFLSKHREYLLRQPGKTLSHMSSEPIIGAAIRRACKLLLINREPDRTSRVHVITDGIVWKNVCDKPQSGLRITNSEMRAAYRDYKRNGLNPHLFFYDVNKKLMPAPPWKLPQFKHHWEKYDKAMREKIKSLPQDDVSVVAPKKP